MKYAKGKNVTMKGIPIVIASVILASFALGANEEAGFSPKNIPPGSIVKIVARRPAINIEKAEVVSCTTNQLVIRYNQDRFTVEATNVLQLLMIDRAQAAATSDGQTNSAPDDPSGAKKSQGLLALWTRVKNYFK